MELIGALLLAKSPATDSLGVKLFNDDMMDIWKEQEQDVTCLQDPPGIHHCIPLLGTRAVR